MAIGINKTVPDIASGVEDPTRLTPFNIRTATAEELDVSDEGAAIDVASQWQLMRWKFTRHKAAVFSLWVVLFIYFVGAFAEIIAPQDPNDSSARYQFLPPMGFHLFAEDGWSWAPHVFGHSYETDPRTFRRSYVEDPEKVTPIGLFSARSKVRRCLGRGHSRGSSSMNEAVRISGKRRARSATCLEVHDLKMHFGQTGGFFKQKTGVVKAVGGVELTIADGETVGLVGESDCGRSTLGRTIMRAYEPTSGSMRYRRRGSGEWIDLAQAAPIRCKTCDMTSA